MNIDRIPRISNISDAKLFPNKVVFLSFRHYVTFRWSEPSFEGKNTSGMLPPHYVQTSA